MKSKYIDIGLAREIGDKVNQIQGMDYSKRKLVYQRFRRNALIKNAQIHSHRIEHPDSVVPFCVSRNKNKRHFKKGIENLEDSFNWGKENFNPDEVSESFIQELAFRIAPELYPMGFGGYRTTGTHITGASVTPPYPSKMREYSMPNLINGLREKLKCPNLINKIESAIYSHLGLVKVHPFVDGNGRTSRILQDVVLDHFDLPVPIIDVGERVIYYKLLDRAILSMEDQKAYGRSEDEISEGEKMFYDFIAGKINLSLDKLMGSCENHH